LHPILAYAIEHQAKARAILLGSYRIPYDDIEDVCQDLLVNLLGAKPSHFTNPYGYWAKTLTNTALAYWRRSKRIPPLGYDRPDRRQDPEAAACAREEINEAWGIATPSERRAIVSKLTYRGSCMPLATRVRISVLKRRLRERAAV
jgi:DNA-directed RNA polymerase specialized sigma24 family protein